MPLHKEDPESMAEVVKFINDSLDKDSCPDLNSTMEEVAGWLEHLRRCIRAYEKLNPERPRIRVFEKEIKFDNSAAATYHLEDISQRQAKYAPDGTEASASNPPLTERDIPDLSLEIQYSGKLDTAIRDGILRSKATNYFLLSAKPPSTLKQCRELGWMDWLTAADQEVAWKTGQVPWHTFAVKLFENTGTTAQGATGGLKVSSLLMG